MKTRSFASKLLTFCAATAVAVRAFAGPATISVQVDQPRHAVSPLLWGLFFEDINLSAVGQTSATWAIDESKPLNAFNRRSLHVGSEQGCTLENSGYWGMNFVAGDAYRLSVAARNDGDFSGVLAVQLCDVSGEVIASAIVEPYAEFAEKR